jgi:hypothetical protein
MSSRMNKLERELKKSMAMVKKMVNSAANDEEKLRMTIIMLEINNIIAIKKLLKKQRFN